MKRMTVNELRTKYAEVFGEETKARHKQWLRLRGFIIEQEAGEHGTFAQAVAST